MAEALGTLVIVLAVVAVIAALWALVTYNSLIRLRNVVQESWKQIDVELQRRHDLIPNLVETVKGYASHERATLEAVINARAVAVAPGQSVADQASSENFLTGALKGLLAVSESYPELKADALFAQLKSELATTEDRLAASRRFYNANVRELNTRVETVPVNLVANAFGVGRQDYFEIDDAARTAPEVRF